MAKEEQEQNPKEGTPLYAYEYHHKQHGGGLLGGLFFVFIGVIFLLNNLGLIPWDVWNNLWKFWPVLVIFVGIRMLAGKNRFSRIIISLITLFLFAGVLAYILYYYGVLSVLGLPHF